MSGQEGALTFTGVRGGLSPLESLKVKIEENHEAQSGLSEWCRQWSALLRSWERAMAGGQAPALPLMNSAASPTSDVFGLRGMRGISTGSLGYLPR